MEKLTPANQDSNKNWINNYRMGGYLLLACGLINLRYQWGESDVAIRSATIFIPGAIIIGATFNSSALKVLVRREVQFLLTAAGLALVAFAVTN
jgi:hypothetical protein